jgi:aminopeptidase N
MSRVASFLALEGLVSGMVWLSSARAHRRIDPGIPLALADTRADTIRDLRYAATLTIPASKLEPVQATLTATFALSGAGPVVFDFAQPSERVLSVIVNDVETRPSTRIEAGHIVIPEPALHADGNNTVTFSFVAGDDALNRQDEFLYTLFVPARASRTLPVFDQPNLKARWTLTLDVPSEWAAVANGAERQRTTVGDRTTIQFAETEPLPTYLVAFAAGKFSVETAERHGRTYRMFHRESDQAKVARNVEAIFDLHGDSLRWLEDYTALPYAFGKFDFVLIPSFQFGGMEHPGAVFYNAASLLLDATATENQRLGRASLIAHETAHMWFGDLVTMRWFNDVWMKEVFANFMAAKIVNPAFPDVHHDLRFLYAHYPAAYDVDRTAGANPIRQPLDNLSEAGSLYGAIIYQKAPIVMRQLERLIGAESFRDGLRDYLARHVMGNATWPDLITIFDARTDLDLEAWSRAWVEERGRPRLHVNTTHADGLTSISVTTEDPLKRSLAWPQQLVFVLGRGSAAASVDATLGADGRVSVTMASGDLPDGPAWVLPTGEGLGYGDFVLAPDALEHLADDLSLIRDPLTRGAALVTLYESMLEGRLAPGRLFDAILASVPQETHELTVARSLGYLQSIFWRFTAEGDRPAAAARLEPWLSRGLEAATTTSQKSVWFSAIRTTALSSARTDWLTRVWRREVTIEGLPLSEADETELAADLALRGVDVLDAQLARITNPDRRSRFTFVRPALSTDPTERTARFESFRKLEHRQREAWVLEAMGYLHHPLRAADSAHLVLPALALVRDIRDTGDIFFPKRWVDATLSGHRNAAVADDVRRFITQLPDSYPERLRWVLLSSADGLFKAAR